MCVYVCSMYVEVELASMRLGHDDGTGVLVVCRYLCAWVLWGIVLCLWIPCCVCEHVHAFVVVFQKLFSPSMLARVFTAMFTLEPC